MRLFFFVTCQASSLDTILGPTPRFTCLSVLNCHTQYRGFVNRYQRIYLQTKMNGGPALNLYTSSVCWVYIFS